MHNASRNSIARAVVLALCCLLSTPAVARAQANDRVGQLQRAAANIAGDRLAEAERQLNQILKETPEEATALNLLGALRAKQGRLEEAEALFTRAVRSDAGLAGAHMNLAHLYLLRREPEKGAAQLREVLRLEPSNAEAAYRLAWLLLSQNRVDECVAFVESLKETQTLSAPLLAVAGDAYLRKGDRAAAVASFKKAAELNPSEPSYHFAVGSAWLRYPPDVDEAERAFRQFLKLRPDDAQGQIHLGYVLLKQKRLAEARAMLEPTARGGAATAEVFYYLGLIAQEEGEDARAVELFEKSVSVAPAFVHAHAALGAAFLKLKDYARAQAALEEAVKLDPEEPKPHYNLALLYARLKQPERAQEEMRIVERLKNQGKELTDEVAAPRQQ
ncbi:MAG TPA: tetratricopeptide repeat protein [Pyrinomonadaceae bacterium]|nr:tetratricopeptide repeat protein [Pyrinomonadaceae bacterium]